jgi:hypothetical protein
MPTLRGRPANTQRRSYGSPTTVARQAGNPDPRAVEGSATLSPARTAERLTGDRDLGNKPPVEEEPVCPVHNMPMVIRAKVGKPARFTNQQTQTYTLIFRCPVPQCDETKQVTRQRYKEASDH